MALQVGTRAGGLEQGQPQWPLATGTKATPLRLAAELKGIKALWEWL